MDGLPEPLMNRFHLYLNILPVVDEIGQILLLVTGILLVLFSIVRASMRFSKSVQQNSRNISNQQQSKYINFGRDIDSEQGSADGDANDGDDETQGMISYEMADKRIRSDDILYEVNLSQEQQYMLEREHAISEDDDSEEKQSTRSDSLNSDKSYGEKESLVKDMPHLVSNLNAFCKSVY